MFDFSGTDIFSLLGLSVNANSTTEPSDLITPPSAFNSSSAFAESLPSLETVAVPQNVTTLQLNTDNSQTELDTLSIDPITGQTLSLATGTLNSVRPYTIKPGDTLSAIAQRELGDANLWGEIQQEDGSTLTETEARNLEVGQVVYLVDQNPTVAPPTSTIRPYTVKPGDTLSAIAKRELGDTNRWREIQQEDGSTFTETEARSLEIGQVVYLVDNDLTNIGSFDLNQIYSVVTPSLLPYAQTSIPLILAETKRSGITDPAQIAYILATTEHESLLGRWMEELASGSQYEGRKDLGNIYPGDGRRFKGRGYVQITGRSNYQDWSNRLGIDLVANPEKASEPEIAAKILVQGMRDGTFTGVGLSNYINGSRQDFYNARRIVNGLNVASKIAAIAQNYLTVLS
ncbi:LysM peptidoglycan-binding domain-containing protein [Lyngbya aestuarii]|uniref:LysM peptidoglycan-binding domain-containing protein n=1 Tax=Lyngbya aestuarii TaxID=118322 RepID=UPI00403DED88